jgi:hypothetical protein
MSKTKEDIEANIKPTKKLAMDISLEDICRIPSKPTLCTSAPLLPRIRPRLCEKRAALGICGLRRRSNIHDEIDTTRKSAMSVYIRLLVFGFRRR